MARRPFWLFALAGLAAEGAVQISNRTWLAQTDFEFGILGSLAVILLTQIAAGFIASWPMARHKLWRGVVYGLLATLAHQIASFFAVLLAGGVTWIWSANANPTELQLRGLIEGSALAGFVVLYWTTLFVVWRRYAPDAPNGDVAASA